MSRADGLGMSRLERRRMRAKAKRLGGKGARGSSNEQKPKLSKKLSSQAKALQKRLSRGEDSLKTNGESEIVRVESKNDPARIL